jgi:hypothetical protein
MRMQTSADSQTLQETERNRKPGFAGNRIRMQKTRLCRKPNKDAENQAL